ncbi:MAG: hypothetical protein QOH69_1195 [Actinomycetota bacterium]|jgi:uncharacterized membrane protein HdeD (DUF308 family)|nr:hypothetical protein [Actinomycetota bacterium]
MSGIYDPTDLTSERRNLDVLRAFIIFVALAAVVIGTVSLIWTGATLVAISILFGVFLIVAAIFRIAVAFENRRASAGGFVFNLIVAAVLFVTGFVCLNSSAQSLTILALFVGIAWIFDGVGDLFAAGVGYTRGRRGLVALSGVVSILAGIAVLFLPTLSLTIFVKVGAILLIVVGITALFTLPRRAAPIV